jgi:hypothetical protein
MTDRTPIAIALTALKKDELVTIDLQAGTAWPALELFGKPMSFGEHKGDVEYSATICLMRVAVKKLRDCEKWIGSITGASRSSDIYFGGLLSKEVARDWCEVQSRKLLSDAVEAIGGVDELLVSGTYGEIVFAHGTTPMLNWEEELRRLLPLATNPSEPEVNGFGQALSLGKGTDDIIPNRSHRCGSDDRE